MLSIVIPCFNEEEVLELTYETIVREAGGWDEPIEIILVDDGSQDTTWSIIESLCQRDRRVRGVKLSRNFGHQAALGAGLERAEGEAVVVLDSDLQDPPSLVPEMIARWREGFDVVYAQRTARQGESYFKRITGHLFYRLLDRLNQVAIPHDTGEFALMDARVVRTLSRFREHGLFWRGLRCWGGFRQTAVQFDRPPRAAGNTKYSLRKLIELASNGLLSFSAAPLRLSLYVGVAVVGLTCMATLAFAGYAVATSQLSEWPVSPTALAGFFLGGVQLVCLGILGEYVHRIYDEVRDRPRWIVESTRGAASDTKIWQDPAPTRRAG